MTKIAAKYEVPIETHWFLEQEKKDLQHLLDEAKELHKECHVSLLTGQSVAPGAMAVVVLHHTVIYLDSELHGNYTKEYAYLVTYWGQTLKAEIFKEQSLQAAIDCLIKTYKRYIWDYQEYMVLKDMMPEGFVQLAGHRYKRTTWVGGMTF